MNVDGTDVNRLTKDPAKDGAPAWSPDGKYIVFTSHRADASGETEIEKQEIWRMQADGTELVRLTDNEFDDAEPSWSPDVDSPKISFTSDRDGNQEIYVMDIDGRNQKNLTKSDFDENYSAWSPDGNWLAFSRFTTNNEIFIMTVAGDHLTNITRSNDNDWQPVWVPR